MQRQFYQAPKYFNLPSQFKTQTIAVVGDVMLDHYMFGRVDRISPEAPVPVVHIQSQEYRLGGAANVANNLACLGLQPHLFACVGLDDSAQQLKQLCTAQNVHANFTQDTHYPTTLKTRIMASQQQLLRIDHEAKPSTQSVKQIYQTYCRQNFDTVILSDYHKGVLSNIATYIEHANLKQQKILIDPKGQDYQIYKNASLLTPNQKELQAVIGSWQTEDQLHTKAHQLIEHLNLQALLLTRSEQGMTLFYKNQHFDFATQAKEVFDVSGAGDTVIASLAAFWGAGLPLLEAVYLANYAAGIAVSKLGTAPVYLQEVASLFDAN